MTAVAMEKRPADVSISRIRRSRCSEEDEGRKVGLTADAGRHLGLCFKCDGDERKGGGLGMGAAERKLPRKIRKLPRKISSVCRSVRSSLLDELQSCKAPRRTKAKLF